MGNLPGFQVTAFPIYLNSPLPCTPSLGCALTLLHGACAYLCILNLVLYLRFCLPYLDCELLEGRVTSYSSEIKIIWGSEIHITTIHLFYSHLINDYQGPGT